MKTKLGISVELTAAIAFLVAGLGGFIPTIIVAAYILLAEEDKWLRFIAVKATVLLIVFSLIYKVAGYFQSMIWRFTDYSTVFGYGTFIYKLFGGIGAITLCVLIVKLVTFLLLAVKALKQETIEIPVIDQLIKEHI